jgi:7,8-dihydro-6-hydroxymethylpterin dimethyltransferase
VLREDGTLIATTKNEGTLKIPREEAAGKSRGYVRRHWKYIEPISASAQNCGESGSACRTEPVLSLLDRIQSHSLCISGMAFQDAWNIDLERLQRCCVHVATTQKKLIPFCAYYMTNSNGQRLIDRSVLHLLK